MSVSGALAASAAWTLFLARPAVEARSVRLVDTTPGLQRVLRERADSAPSKAPRPVSSGPAPLDGSSGPADLARYEVREPPPLQREPLDEDLARTSFYASLRRQQRYRFQPQAHVWNAPNYHEQRVFAEHPDGRWTASTNSLGFRGEAELRDPAPDLRVLVVGDSHTAGVVPDSESFASVLEELLRAADPGRSVEVLNAGIGGAQPYNYLGLFEYLAPLVRPQVLVVALYAGNDFSGPMALQRYYTRRGSPRFGPHGGPRLTELPSTGALGQMLTQAAYFLDNPDDLGPALETVAAITVELERQAELDGVRVVYVHLPAAPTAQPGHFDPLLEEPLDALGITRAEAAVPETLAPLWLDFLARRGLPHVDLLPVFEASEEPCYWLSDMHLNTHGHRKVAEVLAPLVQSLVE